MAAFLYGDQPVSAFDYEIPAEFGGTFVTSLEVNGVALPTLASDEAFIGTWTALPALAVGAYPVYGVIALGARKQRVLVDTLVIVDPADQWVNVITARQDWNGAAADDGTLHRLLVIAREQVEEYAPDLKDGEPVPERYRRGQLTQARNTFNAGISNGDGGVDFNGNLITPRPLDWAVKQLLRPQRAKKALG